MFDLLKDQVVESKKKITGEQKWRTEKVYICPLFLAQGQILILSH